MILDPLKTLCRTYFHLDYYVFLLILLH